MVVFTGSSGNSFSASTPCGSTPTVSPPAAVDLTPDEIFGDDKMSARVSFIIPVDVDDINPSEPSFDAIRRAQETFAREILQHINWKTRTIDPDVFRTGALEYFIEYYELPIDHPFDSSEEETICAEHLDFNGVDLEEEFIDADVGTTFSSTGTDSQLPQSTK